MNTFLHKKFEKNIIKKFNITDGSSILLAISGGQDSLCLLKLFMALRLKYNLRLGIIHIDHQWRNDSVHNTNHIINYIQSFNLPAYLYQIRPMIYSELEARNLRYQIFLLTATQYNYSIIATAHSSSDQIETCLYNFTRGSTLDGLNSLVWRRKINATIFLIRPLLNFQRWEIKWICRYFWLPIWADRSNLDYNTARNRMRQEFIPYLKYHLQNQIENHTLKFLDNISIDAEYIRQNTIKIYQNIKHESFIAINYRILIRQHLSLQIRVLHLFFLHNANISVPHHLINQIIHQMKSNIRINFYYYHIKIKNNQEWLYFSFREQN